MRHGFTETKTLKPLSQGPTAGHAHTDAPNTPPPSTEAMQSLTTDSLGGAKNTLYAGGCFLLTSWTQIFIPIPLSLL